MTETASANAFSICNVRVFDGHGIREPSTVVIDGELIGDGNIVPAKTIDAEGAVLLPGFIDSHIHLSSEEDLRKMARYGVTTALDMATWPVEKLNSLRGKKMMTDIRGCGLAATAPGSEHSRVPTMPPEALVASPSAAEEFVAARIKEGADYIKVVADVPGPDQETLNALVVAAHRCEKRVVAHAVTTIATSMAQIAGVDFITHAPIDGVMSNHEVSQMVKDNRVSIPTLVMMKGVTNRKGADYSNCTETVAALHQAGVPILAGTDANKALGVPANVEHGISLHEELELLVECGLSTTEALRAATCLPSKYFGLNDRGSIEPGRRADLVLVQGNPVEDITATRRIKRVWIAGKEINVS